MLKSDLLKMIDAAVVDSRKSDMIKDILEMNETDLAKVNKMIHEHADSVRRESGSFGYRYRGSGVKNPAPNMPLRDARLAPNMPSRDVRRVFTNE